MLRQDVREPGAGQTLLPRATFTRRVPGADARKRNKELLSLDHLRAVGDTMPSTTDAFLCISLKQTLLLRDH